jgi:hypothetical protein
MAEHVAGKVREWLQANVNNYPFEDKAEEVQRLTAALEGHMLSEGYTRDEVEDYTGDLGDYVENYFEQVQDPELGFKDSSD